jgi:hypothetical protein
MPRDPKCTVPRVTQEGQGGETMPTATVPTSKVFLDAPSLASRWGGAITTSTLAKWRMRGEGPRFLKLGSRVLYALDEIEAWEETHTR